MISKLSHNISRFFVNESIISQKDLKIYEYGMEILISEAINILAIIIIMVVSDKVLEIAFFMIPFVILRQIIGGYHAKTHIACVITTVMLLITYLIMLKWFENNINIYFVMVSFVLSSALIYLCCPCVHPNKPVLEAEAKVLRRKSFYIMLLFCLIIMLLLIFDLLLYAVYINLGILVCVTIMLVGKFMYSASLSAKNSILSGRYIYENHGKG